MQVYIRFSIKIYPFILVILFSFLFFFQAQAYACYYCADSSGTFNQVVHHTVRRHEEEILKIKKKILCEKSGIMKLQTKNFCIKPSMYALGYTIVFDDNSEKIRIPG